MVDAKAAAEGESVSNFLNSLIIATAIVIAGSVIAYTQTPPSGQLTLNQSNNVVALTKSDTTVLVPTKGLQIGDGSACNITVVGAAPGATAAQLANVQSGQILPLSIVKLTAATTCTTVSALY